MFAPVCVGSYNFGSSAFFVQRIVYVHFFSKQSYLRGVRPPLRRPRWRGSRQTCVYSKSSWLRISGGGMPFNSTSLQTRMRRCALFANFSFCSSMTSKIVPRFFTSGILCRCRIFVQNTGDCYSDWVKCCNNMCTWFDV